MEIGALKSTGKSAREKFYDRPAKLLMSRSIVKASRKNGREGAMYSEPVEWLSRTEEKLIGNVVINAKTYIATIWGKLQQRILFKFKDSLGFSKNVCIRTEYFERDLVNYFFENR